MSEQKPTAKWITARVLALQSHFYQPDISLEIEKLAMMDWIAALGDIPKAAIEQAVTERIRSDGRARPTPGEIRARAWARVGSPNREHTRAAKPDEVGPRHVVPPEELQRRRKMQPVYQAILPILRNVTGPEDAA